MLRPFKSDVRFLEEVLELLGIGVVFFGGIECAHGGFGVGCVQFGAGLVEEGGMRLRKEFESFGAVWGGAFGVIHLWEQS